MQRTRADNKYIDMAHVVNVMSRRGLWIVSAWADEACSHYGTKKAIGRGESINVILKDLTLALHFNVMSRRCL
jgi:hypothetical protein